MEILLHQSKKYFDIQDNQMVISNQRCKNYLISENKF